MKRRAQIVHAGAFQAGAESSKPRVLRRMPSQTRGSEDSAPACVVRASTLRHPSQDGVQDAAVAVVLDLDGRVDAAGGCELDRPAAAGLRRAP